MVSGRWRVPYPTVFQVLLGGRSHQLCSSVRDQNSWAPVLQYDAALDEFLNSLRFNVGDRLGLDKLREVVNGDNNILASTSRLERTHDVKANCMEGGVNLYRLKETKRSSRRRLHPLTQVAALNEALYIIEHFRPEVSFPATLERSANAHVSTEFPAVEFMQDLRSFATRKTQKIPLVKGPGILLVQDAVEQDILFCGSLLLFPGTCVSRKHVHILLAERVAFLKPFYVQRCGLQYVAGYSQDDILAFRRLGWNA